MSRFKPGQSGNPAGRPKGSRNRLGEAFLEALEADFKDHGVAALQAMRADKPNEYIKVIAALLPQQMEVKHSALDGLDHDHLIKLADVLDRAIDAAAGDPARADEILANIQVQGRA